MVMDTNADEVSIAQWISDQQRHHSGGRVLAVQHMQQGAESRGSSRAEQVCGGEGAVGPGSCPLLALSPTSGSVRGLHTGSNDVFKGAQNQFVPSQAAHTNHRAGFIYTLACLTLSIALSL